MAGQSVSNTIAVNQPDLTDGKWIRIDKIEGAEDKAAERLKNLYVCLFNRHRIDVNYNTSQNFYVNNVYPNNVIPLFPWVDKFDPRLTDHQCDLSQNQYGNDNISLIDNVLQTDSSTDWMYFAANLRGNAKETVNMINTLYPGSTFEGIVKVFGGATFVYWNPANGPNSFLVVDGPVLYVNATRTDIQTNLETFPSSIKTFNPTIYQAIYISDSAECERKFSDLSFSPIYTNYFGFGDSAAQIYVGGSYNGVDYTSILKPGDSTIVKIELSNNAGFDWNMKAGAILRTEDIGINYTDSTMLMKEYAPIVQMPLDYKFMSLIPPPDLAPYVSFKPSNHTVGLAPLFFDFANINVASIR